MFDLPPPRHISTLPKCEKLAVSTTSPVSSQLRTCEQASISDVLCTSCRGPFLSDGVIRHAGSAGVAILLDASLHSIRRC